MAVIENLETYVDPNFSIEMVKISSGVFSMGSPNSEIDRNSNEGPQHPVTISKDFYMGKYELTQGQWASIVGGYNPWPNSDPSSAYGASASHPAYMISWDDITKEGGFLDKLNQASGCDIHFS